MGKIIESYYGENTSYKDTMFQKWELPENMKYIGKRGVPKEDAHEKVSGESIYTRDVILPGMLYAKQLQSPHAHARIKSIDISKAEALQGVRAIIKYDDPEAAILQMPGSGYGAMPAFSAEANFYHQPLGLAIAADTQEILDKAMRLVEIEWEELPHEIDWNVAMKDEVILEPDKFPSNTKMNWVNEYGHVDEALEEADHIIEWQMDRRENSVCCVEPMLNISHWEGEDNLNIWSKIQFIQHSMQTNFPDIKHTKIRNTLPTQGGTFGGPYSAIWGKYSVYNRIGVELSRKARRPVKFMFDEHFFCHDWNVGSYIMKAGFMDDGTVVAVDGEFRCQRYGWFQLFDLHEQTRIHNMREHLIDIVDSRSLYTTPHRDGGDMQTISNMLFQRVAGFLGMDPTEVARKNYGANGHTWEELQEWRDEHFVEPDRNSLEEVIAIAKEKIDWDNKWHAPGEGLLPNGRYHGIGVSWAHEWGVYKMASSAGMTVMNDGTVKLLGTYIDCGNGAMTTYCQVIADVMGMKLEDIGFRPRDANGPYTLWPPGASLGCISNIPTIVKAAKKLKQMLLELATQSYTERTGLSTTTDMPGDFPGLTWEELDIEDSVVFEKANPENRKPVIQIMKTHEYSTAGAYALEPPIVDDFTGPQLHRPASMYQIHMVEVEVDPDTGQVFITKVVNVNDIGLAINPDNLYGQQYGGSYMGLGTSNMEEVLYCPQTGVKLNDDMVGYPISLLNDIGPIDCNLVETRQGYGAYGSGGIGENVTACTYNATYDAVHNAIGKWLDTMPSTPDRVLKALGKI